MCERFLFLGIAALLATTPATAQTDETRKTIADDYWAYHLEHYPQFTSSLGIADPIGRVTDASLEARDKRVAKAKMWFKQLNAIDVSNRNVEDKSNYGILHRRLAEQIEANTFGQRTINFTNRDGWLSLSVYPSGFYLYRVATNSNNLQEILPWLITSPPR